MKLPIELSESQAARLRAEASRFGVAPEQLAAVADLLTAEASDFDSAAMQVLAKYEESYRRLA